ncbi:MAG TPA: TadE/TadG family type IV pilus assembly protein [Propionibacteriaceae bacterium]|nr:TadE/TadG family type IV pilus assembly protein [Propionibacteriaceae bacterium]
MSQSVQYALVFPAVILSTLGIIQAGVWLHGRHVIAQAAHAAADASRSADAGSSAGGAAARRVTDVGGLRAVAISVQRTPTQVAVTVTATIPMFFELGLGTLSETAIAPVERVTAP